VTAPAGDIDLAKLGFDESEVGVWADAEYGGFADGDGKFVRVYDDIELSRPIPVSGGNPGDASEVGAGTICTVLGYTQGVRPIAHLECSVGGSAFAFGFEELNRLKLHKTSEEKYSR
jgi:hypothetical protein